MCEMHVLDAYEGLGQGTALNVTRDEVRHIQRGMAASLELVLLASAEWADPMKGQNGALLSDIQESLEEAPPSGAGATSAPWLLHTDFLQAQVLPWMGACLRCSCAACGGCDDRGCVPLQSGQGSRGRTCALSV